MTDLEVRRSKRHSKVRSSSDGALSAVGFDLREARREQSVPDLSRRNLGTTLGRNITFQKSVPVSPVIFLQEMLKSRGYDHNPIMSEQQSNRVIPTVQQVEDYDNELVWAVRLSDISKLNELSSAGKCMCACNRFSESIIHMACRRSTAEVVEFLLSHGGTVDIVDDFGRTPLHDACWRTEPCFEIVALLMAQNVDLIRNADKRGAVPLNYVRTEHWGDWCSFLFNHREKYWAIRSISPAPASIAVASVLNDSFASKGCAHTVSTDA